jgi:type VI secretion system secreted protein VgrG
MSPDVLQKKYLGQRTFTLNCSVWEKGISPKLHLVGIEGQESFGELYSYRISLREGREWTYGDGVARHLSKYYLHQELSISIELDDGSQRHIHGFIRTWRHLDQIIGKPMCFEAELVPYQWLMTRNRTHKIHHNQSVRDILTHLLSSYPGWYELQLGYDYPIQEYQVQYGESDYDYLIRQMQSWGICHYWTHTQDRHTLIICDESGAKFWSDGSTPKTITYDADNRYGHEEETIYQFRAVKRFTPSVYSTSDYDAQDSYAAMHEESRQHNEYHHTSHEIYHYPGNHPHDWEKHRAHRAEIRLKQHQRDQEYYKGEGHNRRLRVGYVFELEGKYPQKQRYIIRQVKLDIQEIGEESREESRYHYQASFIAHKPEHYDAYIQSQPRPIARLESALVVGPSDQEIYTDEQGRVKIHFYWDRASKKNQDSSRWVRVNQSWSGQSYGQISIPRIGQEVLIDYEYGDPDRPLVVGRMYNQNQPPPWTLPGNKTQTGLLTRSSPRGSYDTANALRFEDRKGEEQLWLHAERNQDLEIEEDESHWVGHDRKTHIERDETSHIKGNRTESVGHNEQQQIGRHRTRHVEGSEEHRIGQNHERKIGGHQKRTTYRNQSQVIGISSTESIGLGKSQTIGGVFTTAVGMKHQSHTGQDRTSKTGNHWRKDIGKSYHQSSGQETWIEGEEGVELRVGTSVLRLEPDGSIYFQGKQIQTNGQGMIRLNGEIVALNESVGTLESTEDTPRYGQIQLIDFALSEEAQPTAKIYDAKSMEKLEESKMNKEGDVWTLPKPIKTKRAKKVKIEIIDAKESKTWGLGQIGWIEDEEHTALLTGDKA